MAGNSFQPPPKKIVSPGFLATLEKFLPGPQRRKSGTTAKSQVIDLVSRLESEDHTVCSRIDSKIYCTIIKTLLEFHNCRDSERGVYLLGAALYYDSLSESKKCSVTKKKEVIGKGCLSQLIDFFIDGSKTNNMRQWVGILALQLFQDCDSNVQKFELGPEQQRRELGNVVLKEPNEIIRIICGQIIASLLSAGVFSEHLWPINTDKQLYENFPKISPGGRGWNQQFQNYMDSVYEIMEPSDSIGQLYFTQNVSLTPEYNFGPEDHNVVIVVESTKMIIWAGVVADTQNFNHCLEVPLVMIHKMLIKPRSDSQLSGVLNVHLFLDTTGPDCYLDCAGTALSQVCMVLQQSVVEAMRDELSIVCPHLEVLGDDMVNPGDFNSQDSQQNDWHCSQSIEAVHCSGKGISVVRPHPRPSTEIDLGSESEKSNADTAHLITKAKETLAIVGSSKLSREQAALTELSTTHVCRSSSKIEMAKESIQASTPKKTAATERKHSNAPKSKAKPPLRQVHKAKIDIGQWPLPSDITLPTDQPISNGLSYEEIENNMSKVVVQFTSADAPTRRGVVLASKGIYEIAAGLLSEDLDDGNSNQKRTINVFKENGQLNNSTKPHEGNEISKSHPTQANKDKYKHNVPKSDNRALKADLPVVRGTKLKKYSLKRTSKDMDHDDCYNIPPEEICEGPLLATKNSSEGIKPTSSDPTTRQIVAKNTEVKNNKSTKPTKAKRQSAPAALEPATRGRTQRRAAVVASKKLMEANSSDEEKQINEIFESKNLKLIQKNSKSAAARSHQPLKAIVNPSTTRHDQTVMQQRPDQQDDSHSPILIESNCRHQSSEDLYGASPTKLTANPARHINTSEQHPPDDLYDATPRKPTTKLVITQIETQDTSSYVPMARKRFQSLGEMAVKMGNLLGGLDGPDASDDIAAKQVELRAKIGRRKLSNGAAEKVLVNDYLCRKTPIVGFNDKGARNQGLPVRLTSSIDTPKIGLLELSTPTRIKVAEGCKRKRKKTPNEENGSPLRKRQSRSPSPNRTPVQGENGHYFRSSPPEVYEMNRGEESSSFLMADNLPAIQRSSNPSSQGSRVDKNGSPLAPRSSHIDRIGNVKRKLLDGPASEVHTAKSTRTRPLLTTTSPEIFGPKLKLGSIPKARPSSSLQETAPRYIPHKKIQNGHYEAFNTNEIIAPEKALIDPFIDKVTRPTSGFSDRLLAGSSSSISGSKMSRKDTRHVDLNQADMKTKTLTTYSTNYRGSNSQVNSRVPRRLTEVFLDDDEETLVERGNRLLLDKLSPPEMTSDTTYDSGSPLTDKSKAWNQAIRPHYTNLAETIHHIADEVIIRLSNEEDAMKLISSQYKENGNTLMNQTAQKRSEEKAIMMTKMDQRKEEMVTVYSDAKGLVNRTRQTIEKLPLSAVDKLWKTRCEALQAQIDKGKMASEG